MGQAQSLLPPEVLAAQGFVTRHAGELKVAASIPYEQFLSSIQALNEITNSFQDISGKSLIFQVKKGTDKNFLWRGTVRIICHRVDCSTRRVDSCRVLNLKQYIHLQSIITHQAMLVMQEPDNHSISTSTILTQVEQGDEAEMSECCICMERKAHVILPCSHNYCEQCIDQWGHTHDTCPICRATIGGSDETWVLPEVPNSAEIASETTGYLLDLASRSGYADGQGNPLSHHES